MRVLLLAVVLCSRAEESPPNWTNRYNEVFLQLRAERSVPSTGTMITVVRRIGGPETGRIDYIAPGYVVIDGKRYDAPQLIDDTCDRLFPDYYASRHARKQVIEERDAYLMRAKEAARKAQQSLFLVSDFPSAETSHRPVMSSSGETVNASPPPSTEHPSSDVTPVSVNIAPPSPAPSLSVEDLTMSVVFGVMILAAVVIIGYKAASDASQRSLRKRLADEADKAFDQIQRNGGLRPIASHLCLKPGEHAFMSESCALSETRAVREHSGMGVGFTVARGVRIGLGSGTSVSVPTMTKIDAGTLVLTSSRLVFDGSHADRTIPLPKILSVTPYLDALELSIENRQKSMYFSVSNPVVWAFAIRGLASGELLASVEQTTRISRNED